MLTVPLPVEEDGLPEEGLPQHSQALRHEPRAAVLAVAVGGDPVQVEGGEGELQHRPAGLGGQPLAAAAGVEEPPHVPLAVRPAGHLDAGGADDPARRLVLEGQVQVDPLRVEGQIPGGGDELPRLCLRVGLPAQV